MKRLGLAIALTLPFAAQAAEVTQDGFTMTIRGPIEQGDALRMYSVMKAKGTIPTRIILDSRGGLVSDAVQMARYIRRDLKAVTEVQGECWSACVMIFAGGIQRYAGPNADFRVHRAAVDGQDNYATSNRLAGEYTILGVPRYIINLMMDTPAMSFTQLTDQDLIGWALRKGTN